MENQNECRIFSVFPYDSKQLCLSSNTKDKDYFLPAEIIVKIFSFLSIPELRTCAAVSKYWNSLSSSTVLWINIKLKAINIKIKFLERILNFNVKAIDYFKVRIIEAENIVPPFFKTSRFDSLQKIVVFDSITLEVLNELLGLSPNLRYLEMPFYCGKIGSNFFRQIVKLRFLERLHVFSPGIIKNVSKVIEIMQNVEKFETLKDIYFCPDFNGKRRSEQFYENFLRQCPNLEMLAIPDQHINESTFNYILRMKSLKYLDIREVILPSNFFLSHMENYEKLINLQKLEICEMNKPNRMLTILLLCPNLESLSIGGVITYSIFEKILTYKNLKKLHLY